MKRSVVLDQVAVLEKVAILGMGATSDRVAVLGRIATSGSGAILAKVAVLRNIVTLVSSAHSLLDVLWKMERNLKIIPK